MRNPSIHRLAGQRKGILLAGGTGSRLFPATCATSKQLLPVYDKPLIYYPLTTLIEAGVREVLLISTPQDQPAFARLLGDGSAWGMRFEYAVQPRPDGIAQALLIAREFLAGGPSALALGDNLFLSPELGRMLRQACDRSGAVVWTKPVADPERFGVVELSASGAPLGLEEKPLKPRSNLAVLGLYFYDSDAPERAAQLKPSQRGELEITDLNRGYLRDGMLSVGRLPINAQWFDAGTSEALFEAASCVRDLQRAGRTLFGSPELAAYRHGWISSAELAALAEKLPNEYGRILSAAPEIATGRDRRAA